jgi:hypothetical protein
MRLDGNCAPLLLEQKIQAVQHQLLDGGIQLNSGHLDAFVLLVRDVNCSAHEFTLAYLWFYGCTGGLIVGVAVDYSD